MQVQTAIAIVIAMTVVVFPVLQLLLRANKSWTLWKANYASDIKLANSLANVLNHFSLIRANKRQDRETLELEEAISDSLDTGFNLWYHDLRTSWYTLGSLQSLKYVLWALSPFLTNQVDQMMTPADFLVLLYVIDFVACSANGLQNALIGMYTSGSMVQEIAKLLNFQTTEEMQLLPNGAVLDAPAANNVFVSTGGGVPGPPPKPAKHVAPSSPLVDKEARAKRAVEENERMRQRLQAMVAEDRKVFTQSEDVADAIELTPRQKLLLEESRSIVSKHLGQSAGTNCAMRISRASFHLRGQSRIFDELVVYDAKGEPLDLLPTGGIVGLRTSAKSVFGALAAFFCTRAA